MSDVKYTYAVARIRALEVSLFSASAIEQLIACKNYDVWISSRKKDGAMRNRTRRQRVFSPQRKNESGR